MVPRKLRYTRGIGIAWALFLLPSALMADENSSRRHDKISFDLPAKCRLGETCWVANYVDVDPSLAAKDWHCEARTYDGHDGVDIAIRDRRVMEQGVSVLSAAPGIVRRVRDGVEDVGLTTAASWAAIVGRECGNGVLITHDEGWETQYCHLKQRSIRVKVGQSVLRGDELGLIGLSGKTEFPHLHFTARHTGQVIDPFTGRSNTAGCHIRGQALWRDPAVTYEEVALYNAGFSATEPQADAIRNGYPDATTVPSNSDMLVLWVDMFGVQADDRLRFRITAPDGKVLLDREERIDRTQLRRFAFSGLRRRADPWPPGLYRENCILNGLLAGPLLHVFARLQCRFVRWMGNMMMYLSVIWGIQLLIR